MNNIDERNIGRRGLWIVMLSFAVSASCGSPQNGPVCEERSLLPQDDAEFFIGSWAGCPGTANHDLEDEPIPDETYCTFLADGTAEFRSHYPGRGMESIPDGNWVYDPAKGILHLTQSGALDPDEYRILTVDRATAQLESYSIATAAPPRWTAVTCENF